MIHEYALEPELVATWHTDLHYYYFINCFGFAPDSHATGRVVAQYPEDWKEKIWKVFRANPGQSADQIKKTRITELLKRFGVPEVYRLNKDTVWNDQLTWLENAEQEDKRRPFHAILASDNPRNDRQVVREADVLKHPSPSLWRVRPQIAVMRQAKAMAAHLEPMLRCATRILFIDPYFDALTDRYKKPLREFLRIICDGRREVKIEYHTSADYKDAPLWDEFQQDCQKELPDIIPRGFELTVRRWKERWPRVERLHNRYILTDVGGVLFAHGLDEGSGGSDDIYRLSRDGYRKRCNDYGHTGSNPAFDPEVDGPVVITGVA